MGDQTAKPAAAANPGHAAAGHVIPVPVLLGVCVALLVLTWVTLFVAGYNLGTWNLWVALGIASTKALLVALFFMHLRYDRPFNAILLVGAVLFLLLFVGLTLLDTVHYRPYVDQPESKEYAPLIESKQQRS
jgi:cytochrome c oxidase subunit 4